MKKNLILILLGIFVAQSAGQKFPDRRQLPSIGVVTGTVIDSSSGGPVVYASVSLIRIRDRQLVTGGVTNEQGKFRIKEIPLGRYRVRVEYIGYKPAMLGPITLFPGRGGAIEQDLGIIRLQQRSIEMQEVDVFTERPLFTQTLDKKVFNVEKNTLSVGGTVLDALRQVPSVDVDIDGNVSLRGNQNVNILIDGKPSSLTGGNRQAVLEAIPADNVQEIEVITNPSAKYDPDGMAGIINIVLKENKLAGFNGSGSLTIGERSKYAGFGQVNFKNKAWNLFLNLSGRRDNRGNDGSTERETNLSGMIRGMNQEYGGTRGGNTLFVRTGAELTLKRHHVFGLTFSGNLSRRDRETVTDTEESVNISTPYQYTRLADENNEGTARDIGLRYDRKFRNPKHTLNVSVNLSRGGRAEEASYYTEPRENSWDYVVPDWQNTTSDGDNRITTLQADYVHPLGAESKLELGYKTIIRTMDDDFVSWSKDGESEDFTYDISLSNHFQFEEGIHAVYSQFSAKREKLGLQAGLRAETARTNAKLVTTDSTFENNYVSLFPSVAASYSLRPGREIQLSYSRRINRPSIRRLNPFPSYSNDRNRRQGNPFLRPEYIDVVELNLTRFRRGRTASVGLYARRTTDHIRHYSFYQDTVLVTTFRNLGQRQTLGAEFILTGRLLPSVRMVLSGNLYRDEYDMSSYSQSNVLNRNLDPNSTGFFARVNATWAPLQGTEVMFSTFYRAPFDVPQGHISRMIFTDVSVKKRFWDRHGSLTLQFRDPLDTQFFEFKLNSGDQFYQHGIRNWESKVIMVSFEYRFGKIEERRDRRRNRDRVMDDEETQDLGF